MSADILSLELKYTSLFWMADQINQNQPHMRDAGSIPRRCELGINYRCRMSHLIPGEL